MAAIFLQKLATASPDFIVASLMRRFVALALVASILSVSSIPMLPGATLCAHAAEVAGSEDCSDCHGGNAMMQTMPGQGMGHEMCHDMVAPPQQMDHGNHSMDHHAMAADHSSHHGDHATMQQPAAHGPKKFTEAERECRIECGCGCNRVAKGFPLLLSPHVTVSIDFDSSVSVSDASELPAAEMSERARRIPVPPPQIS